MKKLISYIAVAVVGLLGLSACSQGSAEGQATAENPTTVQVGVIGDNNPEWEHIAEQLEANNEPVEIELVTFTDYVQPIMALENGDIDLHSALTEIYMEAINEESGYSNTPIAYTTLNPMGLFSNKYDSVEDIPENSEIAIPNDVSNGSRALLMLESSGLIEVNDEAGHYPTLEDITSNPKNITFTEIASNQTARVLNDVAASAINNDMATDAGLIPTEDSIYLEPVSESSEPYYNVIASREDETEDPAYQLIVDYYQTEEVKEIIDEKTNGSSIPVW